MNDVNISLLREEDFDSLVQLYEEVWPHVDYDKRAKAYFVVHESKGINYCAKIGDKVVGSRTSFFLNFFYGKERINTVQIGDSCTHASVRGKGIFLKMNEAFLQDFFYEAHGELIFNISVDASRKAYEKLGWQYIHSLMSLKRIINPFHLFHFFSSLSAPVIWDKVNDNCVIDQELLFAREDLMRRRNKLHVSYDEETIKWRLKSYSGIKCFSVNSLGCILYKIGRRGRLIEAEIGELFLGSYDWSTMNSLLNAFFKAKSVDIATVLVSEGHPLKTLYRRIGFFPNPRHKYLNQGVRVESEVLKQIVYVPGNWAISSIDIDTF